MKKLVPIVRKIGYVILLIFLTMALFGPALPIDMALLLASTVLLYSGTSSSLLGRTFVTGTRRKIAEVLSALRSKSSTERDTRNDHVVR